MGLSPTEDNTRRPQAGTCAHSPGRPAPDIERIRARGKAPGGTANGPVLPGTYGQMHPLPVRPEHANWTGQKPIPCPPASPAAFGRLLAGWHLSCSLGRAHWSWPVGRAAAVVRHSALVLLFLKLLSRA